MFDDNKGTRPDLKRSLSPAQRAVFFAINNAGVQGLSSSEVQQATGLKPGTVRPRIRELLMMKLIIPKEKRAVIKKNGPVVIYVAKRYLQETQANA